MFIRSYGILGLLAFAAIGCTPTSQPQKEFSPEIQRSLVPLYVAADMQKSCSRVNWDENGYDQHESKVLSLAAQNGLTPNQIINHMKSDAWMTVEEAYFTGFLQEYDVVDLDDYDARICNIAIDEDRRNGEIGKLITVG